MGVHTKKIPNKKINKLDVFQGGFSLQNIYILTQRGNQTSIIYSCDIIKDHG